MWIMSGRDNYSWWSSCRSSRQRRFVIIERWQSVVVDGLRNRGDPPPLSGSSKEGDSPRLFWQRTENLWRSEGRLKTNDSPESWDSLYCTQFRQTVTSFFRWFWKTGKTTVPASSGTDEARTFGCLWLWSECISTLGAEHNPAIIGILSPF